MPDWGDITAIYTTVQLYIEVAIFLLFELVNDLAGDFSMFITAAATVYIALMGYALMSGWISMSLREAVIRLSKVLLVLVLLEIFRNFNLGLYLKIWEIPDAIGTFVVQKFNPLVSFITGLSFTGGAINTNFSALMNAYSAAATEVASQISDDNGDGVNFGLISWFILMAPMFLTTVSIFLAKFVSAILFLIAPIIFGLSLIGYSNNYLSAWFKSLIVTFLTVIIVYIVGSASLSMVLVEMTRLNLLSGAAALAGIDFEWGVVRVAPLLILSFFSIMLVTQAPSMASALIGVATINSQQATSALQIGALQSASSRGAVVP